MLPIQSCQFITSKAKHVSINDEKVKKLSNDLIDKRSTISIDNWLNCSLHPKLESLDSIAWIFFIDTINFSFWPQKNMRKFKVEYKGETYTGYWSICAALNRGLDNGDPLTDAKFMSSLTLDQFKSIFKPCNGFSEIPLIEERVKAINEAGKVLVEKFDGHFCNVIKKADKSAETLLRLIVDNFSSYKDEAEFGGKTVTIYKRAQILIADIWSCFKGTEWGEFNDLDVLTAFADYRVPQVLLHFGAIEYSQELLETLKKKDTLMNGEEKEVEIRGVTLECIQQIVKYMRELSNENDRNHINSILVDNYLWDYRRQNNKELHNVPFHRTRTIYY